MLQRLFIFLLLFLVLPDLYLYLRFIVRLTAKWWLRVLYWVPSFLQAFLSCVFDGSQIHLIYSERYTIMYNAI